MHTLCEPYRRRRGHWALEPTWRPADACHPPSRDRPQQAAVPLPGAPARWCHATWAGGRRDVASRPSGAVYGRARRGMIGRCSRQRPKNALRILIHPGFDRDMIPCLPPLCGRRAPCALSCCRQGALRIMAASPQAAVGTRLRRHLTRAAVPPLMAPARSWHDTFDGALQPPQSPGEAGMRGAQQTALLRAQPLWRRPVRAPARPLSPPTRAHAPCTRGGLPTPPGGPTLPRAASGGHARGPRPRGSSPEARGPQRGPRQDARGGTPGSRQGNRPVVWPIHGHGLFAGRDGAETPHRFHPAVE
jgi:hypothetical protein